MPAGRFGPVQPFERRVGDVTHHPAMEARALRIVDRLAGAGRLSAAQAARNCGGVVIAQVRNLVKSGTLDPRLVKVPGIVVDAVLMTENEASVVFTAIARGKYHHHPRVLQWPRA